MSEEQMRFEYDVFLIFYRDVPFYRIPRRFVREGVYGIRLVTFGEFKRLL